ncbi:hypothetical protein PAXRUDRAFT_20277 [Paxillus rubicundulus Ve08.2h10]|uniref:Uncharacterized protein n=1 Tax=Paxillus rubicundulus Ve08.2h10 TaxID=930991 RepID=A0A0D0CF16_9AGAM|nr:hypothetical protein PAXRUDRAFT_20277 [Paxillus rubicundulus Ve08.2h10]
MANGTDFRIETKKSRGGSENIRSVQLDDGCAPLAQAVKPSKKPPSSPSSSIPPISPFECFLSGSIWAAVRETVSPLTRAFVGLRPHALSRIPFHSFRELSQRRQSSENCPAPRDRITDGLDSPPSYTDPALCRWHGPTPTVDGGEASMDDR